MCSVAVKAKLYKYYRFESAEALDTLISVTNSADNFLTSCDPRSKDP